MRQHFRLFALLAALALCISGLVATSAQAAVKTTVLGRVVDATTAQPLRGIQVYAVNLDQFSEDEEVSFDENEGFAYLFATDSNGQFSGRAEGRLSPGTWVFGFADSNGSYVSTSREVTLTEGANVLPTDVTMAKGGRVEGTVTAPSGAELKGVGLVAYDPESEEEEETDIFFDLPYGDTDRDGTFDLRGIPAGDYELLAGFDDGASPEPVPFSISGPDDVASVDLTDVQVPVETYASGRTSANKGRAGVSFRVDASQYGIDLAGGTVRLKDGSKTLKAAAQIKANRISFALGGLSKGTHTFHLKYLGGEDTQRARTISVKVKVK